MNIIMSIITNKYVYIPCVLWFSVQLFKVIYDLVTTKKFNFKRIMGAGGMPSSHSAVVTSLATLVGKYEGVDTAIFAISVVFSFIVMYDAAKIVNKIGETPGLSSREVQGKLVEVLGHTPVQVIVGAAIGVLVGLIA